MVSGGHQSIESMSGALAFAPSARAHDLVKVGLRRGGIPRRAVVERHARAQREGDHVVRAIEASRPAGCQRGRDVVVFVAEDAILARGVVTVPLDETFEDEIVGDKLVRPIVVRAASQ